MFTVWQKPTRRSLTSVSKRLLSIVILRKKGGCHGRLFSFLKPRFLKLRFLKVVDDRYSAATVITTFRLACT
jgi:hypothetical protein